MSASARPRRLASLDVARGLAVVLMIQTHAYDAWVRPAARTTAAFGATRLLGTLPLPMFLVLAGVGLALRAGADGERARRGVVRGGLRVAFTGTALSVAYALLDGGAFPDRYLHVDVLHAIGLSLALLGWASVGRARGTEALWILGLLSVALCPPLTRLGHGVSGAPRYVLAPFVEVPGLSSMPLVPLLGLCALGALLGTRLVAPPWRPRVAVLGGLAVFAAAVLTRLYVTPFAPLSRLSPNIAINVLDLSGRAALACALCAVTVDALGDRPLPRVLAWLSLLGRTSLFVYAVHLPFCYGRLAGPIKRRLDMGAATLWLALLVAAVTLAAWAFEQRGLARAHSTRASS